MWVIRYLAYLPAWRLLCECAQQAVIEFGEGLERHLRDLIGEGNAAVRVSSDLAHDPEGPKTDAGPLNRMPCIQSPIKNPVLACGALLLSEIVRKCGPRRGPFAHTTCASADVWSRLMVTALPLFGQFDIDKSPFPTP